MADDPDWAPKQDMSLLCRVCANQHDYLIPIFEGEGLDHDMPTKMEKHLPVKVRENDKLPTQMCYQCASTIIAWSDLVTNCLEADKKLTRMLRINEKKSAMAAGTTLADDSDHYEDAYDAGGGGGGGDDEDEDFEKEIKQLISDAGVELSGSGTSKQLKLAKPAAKPAARVSSRKRKSEATTPVKRESKKSKSEGAAAATASSSSSGTLALLKPKEENVSGDDRWVWFCCECSEHFDNSSKLATHSSVQHSNGMEICNVCGVEYSVHLRDMTKSNDTRVKLEIVEVREEDECVDDDDDDDDDDDTIESLVVNSGDMEEDEFCEVFICNYCAVYFDTKNSLKAHMKSHRLMYDDSVELYKCQIDHCESSKIYSRRQDMMKHLQIHHHLEIVDISAFTVPMDLYNVNAGAKKTSDSIHSYECEPCRKKYNRKQDIIKHMRNLHNQLDIDVKKHKKTRLILDFPDFEMKTRETFKCEKCEERYLDLDLLMKHMNSTHESQVKDDKVVVHSEQTFACKFCHEDNFLSLHILKVHCEENHNFQSHVYLCPRCSETFTYGRNMATHLKEKHADEKWTRRDFVKTLISKGKGKHEKWDQLYACNFCPKTFIAQGNVESHLESVHKASPNEYHVSSDKTGDSLYCHQCYMFVSKKKLRAHMKQHAESITPVCQLCNETFDNMNAMWSHMFTKHATSSFQCCLCPVVLDGKRQVIKHMRLLHGITVVPHENPAQENDLRKTSRIYVNGVLKYQCQQCTTIVNSFSSLKNHMLTHTGEKPIVCDQCSKQFRTVSQLRVHIVCVHENVRKYGCEYCGHAFACSSNLAQHIRIHTGEKPYVCELCGNRYAQSASLYSHKLTHAQNRCHLCTECGRAFHRVSRLRQHMKIHTGDRPPRSHICEVCQKGFRSNSEMKRHQQIHNAVRSYVCETCGAAFTVKKYLIQHYKVHRDLIETQHVSIETITDLSYDP